MGDQVALVTGGRGFLGRLLVNKLLETGGWNVRILDLPPTITLTPEEKDGLLGTALQNGVAEYVSADLRNSVPLVRVLQNVDVVFHLAAASSEQATNFKLQYDVNVLGTKNVINACVKNVVKKLIYTSSASVVFDGRHPLDNVDEDTPFPTEPMDSYADTKAQAEREVLRANGQGGLLTCALRPSGIFGPGDALMLPTIVDNARKGKMRFAIGSGENLMDFTYVDNVIHGHICAERALVPGSPAAGQAFFITNGEPRPFWDVISSLLEQLGYDRPMGKLPLSIVLPLAEANMAVQKLLAKAGVNYQSEFTPSRIRIASTTRTFSCAKAAKLLGYAPIVPLEEGLRRAVAARPDLKRTVVPRAVRSSKLHSALGGGTVADVLLWRDLKLSVLAVLFAASAYYFLFGGSYKFVQLVATILLYTAILVFTYAHVKKLLGSTMKKLPDVSPPQLSERFVSNIATQVGGAWNANVVPLVDRLFKQKDYILYSKVTTALWVLAYVGRFHISTLLLTVLVAIFVLPIAYESNEENVDRALSEAQKRALKLRESTGEQLQRARNAAGEKIQRIKDTASTKITSVRESTATQLSQLSTTLSGLKDSAAAKLPFRTNSRENSPRLGGRGGTPPLSPQSSAALQSDNAFGNGSSSPFVTKEGNPFVSPGEPVTGSASSADPFGDLGSLAPPAGSRVASSPTPGAVDTTTSLI